MLQAKYAKLKKKKKQLAALKAPKPSESEKTYKKVMEAKDSKEVAKKLIRTGTLQAIQNSYQPFSATHGPGGGFDTGADDLNPEPPIPPPPKKVKDLYESFVSARDREERKGDKAKSANTVYVHGFSVSEELLRNTFSSVGKIVNISMEIDKNCGFITFDKEDSAERAISDYHETSVKGVQLKVSKARRQIIIDPINDASSSATWSSIAASHSQKSSHNDKRNLIRYDEDLF
ncbi:RDBP [Lepeophtheirus salmonis]|uniref:Negative elongation factor E n=1 Tax=Lepeophtheirus salmonis TaxID=72036 RepID=A0A7R8GZQ0_LEPSM|nr:RDBP [Lepeophtheirus salmonis]CAF2768280.1 RDBP [Lepeophtheirus salmonis]